MLILRYLLIHSNTFVRENTERNCIDPQYNFRPSVGPGLGCPVVKPPECVNMVHNECVVNSDCGDSALCCYDGCRYKCVKRGGTGFSHLLRHAMTSMKSHRLVTLYI